MTENFDIVYMLMKIGAYSYVMPVLYIVSIKNTYNYINCNYIRYIKVFYIWVYNLNI